MDNDVLAVWIARKIFECPAKADEATPVIRIAFKAGDYGAELDLGGLGETALQSVIRNALRSFPASGGAES